MHGELNKLRIIFVDPTGPLLGGGGDEQGRK